MKKPFSLLFATLTLGFGLPGAHAVVLEQKFRAGEVLRYQTALEGTVNFQMPADVPFLLAGVPLDIEVKGAGTSKVETLKVDPQGNGTLAFALQEIAINAQTLGQNAKWVLKDKQVKLSLNGKTIAPNNDWGRAFEPKNAIKIGKDGRVKGIERIANPVEKAAEQTPTTPEAAVDKGALASAVLLQALPTLWPQGDVQTGEKWQRVVDFPTASRNDENGAPLPLGQFEMTLKGQEDGLWRVGVVGDVDVDGTKLDNAPLQKSEKSRPRFQGALQKVSGDVWFDAAKGQIARAEFVLDSSFKAASPAKPNQKAELSWLNFTGTVQFERAANTN